MVAFVSNGLLPAPKLDTTNSVKTATFQPNGLLGQKSSLLSTSILGVAVEKNLTYETDSCNPTVPHFAPNGLLSVTSKPPQYTISTELNSSSQDDDDLPPVSEAFGLPTMLLSEHALAPQPLSSSTASTSRFSVRATTFDGKTLFIRRKPKVSQDARRRISPTYNSQRIGNLLEVPIHRLMDDLSTVAAAKLADNRQPTASSSKSTEVEDTLWVDRYRPQRFTELMGNERVARETMAWVKQWDWCVFGSKKGKKRPKTGDENFNDDDEYHRPREKFLLLSGPPGLGKTTLAHVVARQAGYEVMEINASDARSGSIVDDRIRPALESGSAVGSDKPVLLIIDEIDGATGAGENSTSFIYKLVQLAYDRPHKKNRTGQNRGADKKRPILRPIICICNDINASSLAKLKPHAYQIRFSRPADIHTVKRLREVCEMEGLKADSRALTALVGIAKGDLRGCLNTLQFVKSRNEDVTESIIRKATTGMKEAETSLITVLNDLFSPMTKKRVKELALSEEEESKYVARLSREIDSSGRESSIALGCFAHYATLRQHDANFSRYEQANEWLVTFDMLSAEIYSHGDFALSAYLPFTLVPFYPLFQERGGQRVERNQADWDNMQLTKSNEEIYKSLARCLRTASTRLGGDFRHLLSTPTLQLEFAPLINRIISPPLRPVNSQIIKPVERAILTRLVSIMASLELRFFQERGEDGQLSYRLDPPVDVFITYDGKRAPDIPTSRYAVRHLVAGEIDALLITRDADIVEKGTRGKHDFFGKSSSFHKRPLDDPDDAAPNKRIKIDNRDIADKPPVDFFGRLITVPSTSSTKSALRKNIEKKYRVAYKFAEGNSAAVRKPVKFDTFL
ncbi:P-loop containing nucleoside triphosphate hydrolase protein [Collybia nuda]|uniref:P-loop containing nucleoside triphosphate hydrolase protein n=1 Tax=Collybia nuda TaxID=64659 RepID=A0A9P5YK76_9AGAR|nr:P-loop containing nucleoside triphosphate hydrolase protein [Collybia nuda]